MSNQIEKNTKEISRDVSLEELKKFISEVTEKSKKENGFKPERLKYLRRNQTIGTYSSGISN